MSNNQSSKHCKVDHCVKSKSNLHGEKWKQKVVRARTVEMDCHYDRENSVVLQQHRRPRTERVAQGQRELAAEELSTVRP